MKIDFAKFEISTVDFFKLQRLMQWKLWEKLSFGYFWAGTLNKHSHLWNQHIRLCQWVKFHAKQKNFKFRTKISLFSQFSSSLKKLMSHLKSTLSNFWNCKVSSYIKKSFNLNLEVNLDIGFTFSKSSRSAFFLKVWIQFRIWVFKKSCSLTTGFAILHFIKTNIAQVFCTFFLSNFSLNFWWICRQ